MKRRIRLILPLVLLLIVALVVIGLRLLHRLPDQFSNELDCDLYNCTLDLTPQSGIAATSTVRVTLEWDDWQAYTRLEITPAQVTVQAVRQFRPTQTWHMASAAAPGTPYHLTVMRRGEWLALMHDDTLLFHAKVPHPLGQKAGITAGTGWTVDDASIERLEPVAFADNFMRTADEPGGWKTVSGQWKLQSAWDGDPRGNGQRFVNNIYAQNPFAWVGRGATTPAICTTGNPAWEDYTLSVSVQPAGGGAVGALVNMTDARNGLLLRWSPANDHRPDGGQIILYQLVDGRRSVLARAPGGYLPGLWYRLSVVSSLEGVRVLIDGAERLAVKDVTPWRGYIGLYAEGAHGAIFDDLTAYGHTLNVDLIQEAQQFRLSQRILEDKEMQKWAKDWEYFYGNNSVFLHQRSFFGDHRMVVHVTPSHHRTGEVQMVLNGDGENFAAGYRAVAQRRFNGKAWYAIYRNDKRLTAADGRALNDDEEYTLRFWHEGERLWLEQDGVTVLSVQDRLGPNGTRAAYCATGCFADKHDAVVIGRNALDYQFTDAPVDWVGEGTWAPTVRWACDARWSFLGGWSHGDAVLWHKQYFTGDHTLEAFLAPKMEYPNARVLYGDRYCDMAVTICGDGHNPRSGYAGIFGAPDEQGHRNKRTVLMRNGVVVASVNLFLPPKDEVHKLWSHLSLTKHGSGVEFWVDDQRVLTYDDPQPLTGGVPAVWTTDNGLSLARARLFFAQPPRPRTDTQLTLDTPAYPEWCDVGNAFTLNFPNACATTGRPVQLTVVPRGVPAGEAAPAIHGLQTTFAPRTVGVHWYQINATDGETRSPGYHLLIPIFNPALTRDDSHALVLYRFDEGQGNRVKDHSTIGPPADIDVPANAPVRWLPGRGLALDKPVMLTTFADVRKLNSIAVHNAATIECWVSYDTLYPPTTPPIYWEGNIVSWENLRGGRNFSFGFHSYNLLLAAVNGADLQKFNPRTCWTPHNHIGLQHEVVTFDGHFSCFYVNGKLVDEKHYKWEPQYWQPDMPLTFGNEPDHQRPFLGTYYLIAIHDQCLPAAQVLRHYQAGPAAR